MCLSRDDFTEFIHFLSIWAPLSIPPVNCKQSFRQLCFFMTNAAVPLAVEYLTVTYLGRNKRLYRLCNLGY